MQIRKMIEQDLPEVIDIEYQTFTEPWSNEDFLRAMSSDSNLYLVAEMDNKIIGYCGYWGVADEAYIYNVAVKNEYRKQRIGYRMLKELLSLAKKKGTSSFTLEVRNSNEAAIHLYEKLGFHRAGIRKDFYAKPKEDAVIMWLDMIQ